MIKKMAPALARTPLIFAHRGLHDSAPENTIAAFGAAIERGFDGIECDVRLDRNKIPIIFHNRLVPDGRPVSTLTRAELSDEVNYEVPELTQALELSANVIWNIEIKTTDAVDETAKVLQNLRPSHQIIVSSFIHSNVFNLVNRLNVEGALLVYHRPIAAIIEPQSLHPRITTIVWNCETVDTTNLQWATSIGLKNMIYGFANPVEHQAFYRDDVAALITDFP